MGKLAPPLVSAEIAMRYCGAYALWCIKKANNDPDIKYPTFHVCPTDLYYDKRREGPVRRLLVEMKFVPQEYDLSHPYEETLILEAHKYWKVPEFNDGTGLVKGESYTASLKPIESKYEAYRGVSRMEPAELIHIWMHMDEYEFQWITEFIPQTGRNNYYTSERKTLTVYPKSLLVGVDAGIYRARLNTYALGHIPFCLEIFTGEKFPSLQQESHSMSDPRHFKLNEVDKTLSHAQDILTDVSRTAAELARVCAVVEKVGGHEILQARLQEALCQHISTSAPLYLTSEDDDLKWLATSYLKGISEGEPLECEPVRTVKY